MNKEEAASILHEAISAYRGMRYETLKYLLKKEDHMQRIAASGVVYQIEVLAVWDDKLDANLRVIGSISSDLISDFAPLSEDFIISKANEFIGK